MNVDGSAIVKLMVSKVSNMNGLGVNNKFKSESNVQPKLSPECCGVIDVFSMSARPATTCRDMSLER